MRRVGAEGEESVNGKPSIRYRIGGTDKKTGKRLEMLIEASSEKEAMCMASGRDILVSSCMPTDHRLTGRLLLLLVAAIVVLAVAGYTWYSKPAQVANSSNTSSQPDAQAWEAFANQFLSAVLERAIQINKKAEEAGRQSVERLYISEPRLDLRRTDSIQYPVIGMMTFDNAGLFKCFKTGDFYISTEITGKLTVKFREGRGSWEILEYEFDGTKKSWGSEEHGIKESKVTGLNELGQLKKVFQGN